MVFEKYMCVFLCRRDADKASVIQPTSLLYSALFQSTLITPMVWCEVAQKPLGTNTYSSVPTHENSAEKL